MGNKQHKDETHNEEKTEEIKNEDSEKPEKEKILSYKESLSKFQGKELKDLKKTFKELCKVSGSNDKTISKKVFEEHFLAESTSSFKLPENLADHIFAAFDLKAEEKIDFEKFVIGMAMVCYGSSEEKMEFCFHILAASKWGETGTVVTKPVLAEMLKTTVSAVNTILRVKANENEREYTIKLLVDDAFEHFAKTEPDKLNYHEFKQWAESNAQVIEFFEFLLHKGYQQKYAPSVTPTLPDIPPPVPSFFLENGQTTTSELFGHAEHFLKLREAISPRFWNVDLELLYKPSVHGYSLKTLYAKTLNKVPVYIILKDVGGRHFGAFCSTPLKLDMNFGDADCFVFSFFPEFKVYYPETNSSNANTSYVSITTQYLAIGGPEASIKIDVDIDQGESKACATYGSPQLSQTERFQILQMEIWGLKRRSIEHGSSAKSNFGTPGSYRSNPTALAEAAKDSTAEKPLSPNSDRKKKAEEKTKEGRPRSLSSAFSFIKKG